MVIRPRRHQRNRQPRPAQLKSPAAPITIIRATANPSPHVAVLLELSGVAAVQWGICTSFVDQTEPSNSSLINDITNQPQLIELAFGSAVNRVGHVVGWTTPPPELVALGLKVAPQSLVTVESNA